MANTAAAEKLDHTSTECMFGMALGGFHMLYADYMAKATAAGTQLKNGESLSTEDRARLESDKQEYLHDAGAASYMRERVYAKMIEFNADKPRLREWLAKVSRDDFDWRQEYDNAQM